MSDLAESKEQMVASYANLAKALKATHKTVVAFQTALSGVNPEAAAELLRDMPKLPTFDESTKAGKKGKKEKKTKDPNAPKRPPSAYLEYQNSIRDQIRAENKELPYADVLRKIAAAWGAMPAEEKEVWSSLTAQRTAEYEKTRSAYAETLAANEGDETAHAHKGVEATPAGPKKRGRKSDADKKQEQEQEQLKQIAIAVDTPSAPKDKKKKAAAAAVAAPVAPESSSSEESSDDSDSDSGSESDASSVKKAPTPPPVKVKKDKKAKKDEPSAKKKSKN